MQTSNIYLDAMKDRDQIKRLDIKTDPAAIKERARSCGIGPGARVLDVGCVSGKVSSILHELVQPDGEIVGIDQSPERIKYAAENFGNKGIDFKVMNILGPLDELGEFDFVWVQFFLEFFRAEAPEIIKKLSSCLKPNGYLCLLDLDNNCLCHYGFPEQINTVITKIIESSARNHNFDPFIGRKLYTYIYDAGYRDIEVNLTAHHLIYDEIKPEDEFNWIKKVELAARMAGDEIKKYPGGFDSFFEDYKKFLRDHRRFIYSPLIMCKGKRPEK
ncbi:MAG: class I SAM-dependent methyltransferase [Spirochaetes bacterium]|nr:class I SAM-dependent methyltransferase [Spirochaetota bacterium]